ncbi:Bug family tripartite tricarboxylate transporter substrate binding protein [Tranquillimonas rosea]|uniref:Bug family tripartite tricarboxylate transporter substrate binding protein n=1 Tax=Tranquillimonas rosea TaxID=641238 RepID=UPI003BAD50F2
MRLSHLIACTTALTVPFAAVAQDSFPSETVEVVTHSGAGGGTDMTARMMMRSVSPILGEDMVVVNRPGGSGAVAMDYVEERPEDGHTVLVYTSSHAVTQAKNGASEAQNLIPIARGTNDPQILFTRCEEFDDTQTFLDAQEDESLDYGVTHVYNIDGISAFLFAEAAGLQRPDIVSFEGGGDLITNLVGGNVDVAVLNYGEAASQVEAGNACPMVVMGSEPVATIPDTPTSDSLGIDADFATSRGFAVAEGTADEVVETLRSAFMEGMQTEEYGEFLTSQGLDDSSIADSEAWGEQMNSLVSRMSSALQELGYTN